MTKLAHFLLKALAGFPREAAAAPSYYPTGVTFYDPAKAWNGYTLIGTGRPRLVDMNGNLVREWDGNGMPNKMLPGGRVMTCGDRWKDGQQDQTSVRTLDWEGRTIWQFRRWQAVDAIEGDAQKDGRTWIARQHHDFQRLDIPVYYVPGLNESSLPDRAETTLVLAHENAVIARVHPTAQLLCDVLLEVDAEGRVTWEWHMNDHIDELGLRPEAFAAMATYPPVDNAEASRHAVGSKVGGGYDWVHINCASYLGPNQWFDAGRAEFNPRNILINSREMNVMMIVDHATGAVVWRTGPYFEPGTPDYAIGHTFGAHAVHMIPRGLPGEGNILVFDNGGPSGYGMPTEMAPVTGFHTAVRPSSRVVEFDPVAKKIVWEYDWYKNHKGLLGHMGSKFYSPFISCAQRLPNGNTVITEGDMGRIFEVTRDYDLAWEYMYPYGGDTMNILYRSYRVGYDWVPQARHADEVAVVPPDNNHFQLPNVRGEYPDTGLAR